MATTYQWTFDYQGDGGTDDGRDWGRPLDINLTPTPWAAAWLTRRNGVVEVTLIAMPYGLSWNWSAIWSDAGLYWEHSDGSAGDHSVEYTVPASMLPDLEEDESDFDDGEIFTWANQQAEDDRTRRAIAHLRSWVDQVLAGEQPHLHITGDPDYDLCLLDDNFVVDAMPDGTQVGAAWAQDGVTLDDLDLAPAELERVTDYAHDYFKQLSQ